MPTVLEGAVSPPHLHLSSRSQTWPSPFTAQHHYVTPSSSPSPMSPQSIQSYLPRTHKSGAFSQDLTSVPTSGWYAPAVSSPECSNDPGFGSYAYDQSCVPHHTSSIPLSLPTPPFPEAAEAPISAAPRHLEHSVAAISPVSVYSRELAHPDADKPEESHALPNSATSEASVASAAHHLLLDDNVPARPHSSPSTFSPNQPAPSPIGMSWPMSSMDLPTPTLPDAYFSHTSYPAPRSRSPRLSEPAMDLPNSMATPQPRRLYTPIAPHPHAIEAQRISGSKRSREGDELLDESKRRKRSNSNSSVQFDLSDEDRLLLRLKEEEAMPWKEIAARFQSDLGKSYQIPALQMRLKRLRERMRVWTEADVRALRMAHEYWVQSKFDIISQKMLEFGAAEKWTARQCARKWQEMDPTPVLYTHIEHQAPTSYTPYMSPVEPSASFMPYLHV